jgi:hypothetical protein
MGIPYPVGVWERSQALIQDGIENFVEGGSWTGELLYFGRSNLRRVLRTKTNPRCLVEIEPGILLFTMTVRTIRIAARNRGRKAHYTPK